jgi:hypothetical protein
MCPFDSSLTPRDPLERRGIFRGLACGWMLFQVSTAFNIAAMVAHTPRNDQEKFLRIPLFTFLITSVMYPLDTLLRRYQFQGFLENKFTIYSKGELLKSFKSESFRDYYAGYHYFLLKTVLLTGLQFQLMRGLENK